MGISPPSLYAAFGNKEQLFRQALDRYADVHSERRKEALSAPTAREAVAAILHAAARSLTDAESPAGCLYVQGIAGAGEHASCIRDMLNAKRADSEREICERLKRAREEGDLPEDVEPAARALCGDAHARHVPVQAVGGASREDLERAVDLAMRVWPS